MATMRRAWISALKPVVAMVFLGFTAVCYLVASAGPRLTIIRTTEWTAIEGRFLGEYSLGFDRLRIATVDKRVVVCDLAGNWGPDLKLRAGVNTTETMFGSVPASNGPNIEPTCEVKRGQTYRVTVWGNNGSGWSRPSSTEVQF